MAKTKSPVLIEPFYCVQKQGQHIVQGKPDPGVYYVWFTKKDDVIVEHSMLVCSPELEILSLARDDYDGNWQYVAHWRDLDGNVHEHPIAAGALEGDGLQVRRDLADGGLRLIPAGKGHDPLIEYIRSRLPDERCRTVSSPGWHRGMFVLPDGDVIGARDGERVILNNGGMQSRIRRSPTAGSLEEWKAIIAKLCERNPLLQLSICVSLTGPVLRWVGQSSYGFHFIGPSSIGKTTKGAIGGSVWGTNPENPGKPNVQGWRATLNGLEGLAVAHNDGFIVLDEMGNVSPRDAATAVYLLAEGREKARKDRDSHLKRMLDWSMTYLSTGEIGLNSHVAEVGKRVHGGQMVRLIELPSDAGRGMGAFEDLHGMASPREFADYLMKASCTYYGTAIRECLRILTGDRDGAERRLRQLREEYRPRFNGGVGEVLRVGTIFALQAAVGEFAIEAGILPWPGGSALEAMETCFQRWIEHRGTTGALDEDIAIRLIRRVIESEYSRFQLLSRDPDSRFVSPLPIDAEDSSQAQRQGPVRDRLGYRRRIGSGKEQEFIFLPEQFDEICRQAKFDVHFVVRALRNGGHLIAEAKRGTAKRTVPDTGKPVRAYVVKSSILETPE
jgi:putative DNA primase/helicase